MPSFANSALRLLRRLLGAPTRAAGPYAGELTALDGNTAIAVTEAAISEAAGLGASYPADTADLAWRTERTRHGRNLLGRALGGQVAEGPRGALATAVGLAMGGTRATAFLSAPDLALARDLLSFAAGRRLPLVVHLCNRALPGHAIAAGSGHEACHLAADSGAFLLFASNVQEAVDLTLIARKVAELTLTPGLVIMDGEQTALAMQEVRLPPAELVSRFLGAPGDRIASPTTAQRLLFGEHRRRIPRWHDTDHPVLLGALQTPESWGLGAAAAATFFDQTVSSSLEQAAGDFRCETGRHYDPLQAFRTEDAQLLLLAQGAAVESATAVAAHLRKTERLRVGVLGIRCLRPFPGPALLAHLGSVNQLLVLERTDTHMAGDAPLLREVRAAIDRGQESDRFGAGAHPGYPALSARERPRLLSVIYGLGGLPLRGADLVRLCREAGGFDRPQVYLGMEFTPRTSDYPKRQVLLDRLRRDYPAAEGLGLRSPDPTPDLRPAGSLTIAVHRRTGQSGEGLAPEAAGFLRRFAGERLRSHSALFSQPLGSYCIERFTCGDEGLLDPGAAMPLDLVLLALDPAGARIEPLDDLQPDGALLVQGPEQDAVLWQTLGPRLQRHLRGSGISLFAAPPSKSSSQDLLLGAICGVLLEKGWVELGLRRLLAAREEQLGAYGDAERRTRMHELQAGLEGVRRVLYQGLPVSKGDAAREQEAPASVRRLGNIGDTYDSLPRFWDQVGVLYQDDASSQLAPTPYMAIGTVPPLFSAFRDLSPLRTSLPRLDPALCTGCGNCWSQCPEAAWGATAATPMELLNAAIPNAEAGALRPLAGKLSDRVTEICRTTKTAPASFGALVSEAYTWLQDKMPMPDERKRTLDAAVDRLVATTGCLPTAIAAPFFADHDSKFAGDGCLLLLALNSADCKGCGICVRACAAGALEAVPQTDQELEQARRIWTTWETLPETTEQVISRSAADPRIGPLPAVLLARPAAHVLAGGDGAEAGSGERLTLRLTLGIAESLQTTRRAAFAREVRGLHKEITGLIRSILADALPADDLDALALGLEVVDTRQAELSTFLRQAEGAIESAVDAARMRRLVELARGLGELAWRLEDGQQGFGRASLGLVLSPGEVASWAGAFPHNSFQIPVTLDANGEGARLAAGLLESQIRQAIEGFVLIRKARLELEKPMDAVRLWSGLEALTWQDLTPGERERCPAVLLVGSSRVLAGTGLSQVGALLGGDLPIKILVLADLDLGLGTRASVESVPAPSPDATTDLGLLALARRDAAIAQTSLATPSHFLESIKAGLEFDGPALFHVHAPSPARHGFATDRTLEQARLAVQTRTFPLFRYDPTAEGVFGTRIDLGGNPEPLATWPKEAASGDERGARGEAVPGESAQGPSDSVCDPGDSQLALTPADWALGEARFRDQLTPLPEDAPDPLPLGEFLDLDERGRRGKTAYVALQRSHRVPVLCRVGDELINACRERRDAWRLLQELGGLVTPFTERVRREAEKKVAAEHKAELAARAEAYEKRIANLREELRGEMRQDIRERLMAMAGYGRSKGQGTGDRPEDPSSHTGPSPFQQESR